MTEVRTRFAPSPTGFLHIGGFRSALYAWLLARHHNGKFILRIEDTDKERKVDGAIKYILDGFEWFGLDIDEGPTAEQIEALDGVKPNYAPGGGEFGPYVQSLRLERYREVAEELVSQSLAYRCDCSPERVQEVRKKRLEEGDPTLGYDLHCRNRSVPADTPHVIRFLMPDNPKVEMDDGIRGKISWDSIPLRDPILMKQDGFPTYHLAVVVDDHDMGITHAMRGEEWIPSSPLHILLYEALGWEKPIFCHLPVVLGEDGKKLSKRHGSTSWSSFKDEGYLPEALLNFIVRIGWSLGDGDDQEIFTREELIEKFSLEQVNSASGVFDYTKLSWMNGLYMRELSDESFYEKSAPYLKEAGLDLPYDEIAPLLSAVKERVKVLPEVPEMLMFLKDDGFKPEVEQMLNKKVDAELARKVLAATRDALAEGSDFSIDGINEAFAKAAERLEVKAGAVFLSTRIAVLGKKATPPLPESMIVLGKERVLRRLEEAIPLIPVG